MESKRYDIFRRMGIRVLFLLLLTAGFSSCKVGKAYVRPAVELPVGLPVRGDSISLGDWEWFDIYTDKYLQQLIRKALEHNKDMRIAAARIKEMAAQKRISVADLLPQLNGQLFAEREFENYRGEKPTQDNQLDAKLALTWELDLWGNLRWGKEAAVAEYLQTVEAQRAMQLTIVAEVASAYYELVALDNELSIVKQTLQARQEGVRLARIRFEGGLTSETSYQQAQVEVARTATLVPDLERKISLKQNDIAFLTGELPQQITRSRSLEELHFPETLPVGLPSELLQRRPDIRRSEQQLVAAHARVGVAYTNMFPRIALTGKYGVEGDELSSLLKSPYGLIQANLITPLFHMGKNRATLKARKAAYEQEIYRYEKAVLNAFRETQNAIVDFNKIREVHALRLSLERAAKSYVDLAQLQYINGVINYLDVLDAQRGYFDVQIGLSNAIRDELIAVVQVYKTLGEDGGDLRCTDLRCTIEITWCK